MQFFKQVDQSTIEFGLIHDNRNTSVYTTTLTMDSFISWLDVKLEISEDGFVFEVEVFGYIVGIEVLKLIEEDEDEWLEDDED